MAKKKNTKVVEVQFIQSPSGDPYKLAYAVGQFASLPEKQAQELIDLGFAIHKEIEQTTK